MGKKYLIDTNILIYYLGDSIPTERLALVEEILEHSFSISIISEMEVLSYPEITDEEVQGIKSFLKNAEVLPLDEATVAETINIRKKYRLKLPDAIIGATAKVHNRSLVTRNKKDFGRIDGLEVLYSQVDKKGIYLLE
jgi:hypothetical protein